MPAAASSPPAYASLGVQHETTVDRVLTELRRAVFEGELKPGTPLREVALAESLAVSRSTVREALALLQAEGLADRVPNRGTSVREPRSEAIRDVSRARTVLEVAGVRCWGTASEAARDEVRSTLTTYAAQARRGAPNAALNEAHLAFHRALVALTGSARLVATEEALSAEIRLALATVSRSKRDSLAQVDSHATLVAMLEAGDLEAAAAEIVRHIADGCDEMLGELGLGD
ncbi:MAG: GntR family transcriptional regulator [Nocardioidaceae bacterium]|nr:GntR family transcriptional regulator [Nocardioidaceae bacterium]